jgi:hypothetical protein
MIAASTTDLKPGRPKSPYQPSLSSKLVENPNNEEPLLEYHDPFHLTVAAILRLRKLDKLPKILSISVEDINNKSKGDSLARAVSVPQITWIAVQVFARATKVLDVSQLEIAVVAFSACAVVIYILDWRKRKGVLLPYTVVSFPGLYRKT